MTTGKIPKVGKDGKCQCSCTDTCPLGKTGMEERCSQDELDFYQHWSLHFDRVGDGLTWMAEQLWERAKVHDESKLKEPELSVFAANFKTLNRVRWGTEEYEIVSKLVQSAKDHHWKKNRHHPEYFGERGVEGMTLVDLVEMFVDWRAANKKGVGPKLEESVKICCQKYKIPHTLYQIFMNTVREMEGV